MSERAPVAWLWIGCLCGLLFAYFAAPSTSHAADPLALDASAPSAEAPPASSAPVPSASPAASAVPRGYSGRELHGLAPLPGGSAVPLALRPPGAFDDDGGPSPVIFPAQSIPLRFNHQKHVQGLGLTCTTCHDKAKTSRRSKDSLVPEGTRCDGCHGSDHRVPSAVKADATELIAQCGFCHRGWQEGDGNRVEPLRIPTPNLRFNHQKHAARNIGCAQCHGEVGSLELATRDQLPRMRGCFKCHQAPDAARGEAKGACTTCHLREPNGRMQIAFASGELRPPRWLHDAGHSPDFIERHKAVAGAESQLCANCHSEKYCTDCHDGRVRPRRVHPNDWLSQHPVVARQNENCTSCHREQSFCLGCHQRAGVSMSGPYGNFTSRGRFHPPKRSWTDGPRGAGHHAWEAQRNLQACVSCHVEKDCATCHATQAMGGRGTGFGGPGQSTNPHPAGFRSTCSTALRKNARPCLVCHDPADPNLEDCR